MVALILANVAAFALETVPSIGGAWGAFFDLFDDVSVLIFTVEYLARLWVCIEHPLVRQNGPVKGRALYALRPAMVIDLLVVLPFLLEIVFGADAFRGLIALRLLRFLKLARYSPALATIGRVVVEERRALFGSVVIMSGCIVLAGSAMYEIERAAQPETFGSIPLAMWWAVSALTTVGYGDAVPVTPLGKAVAGLFMVLGVGLVALPIGILATGYTNEIHRRDFVVTWGMLARVPLFAGLDAGALSEIMKILRTRMAPPGAVIAHRGDAAEAMYFIVSGAVEVRLPRRNVTLGEGEFFGEIALLKKVRRRGTVVAVSRCHLLMLEAYDFEDLMDRKPHLRAQVDEIADKRLREEWSDVQVDMPAEELAQTLEPAP